MTTRDGAAAPGFDVVPVVVGSYVNHPPLEDAEIDASEIVDLLSHHLYGSAVWWTDGDGNRTETSIKQQLAVWAGGGNRSSLVVWLGHGTSDGYDAWLATYDTPPLIRYAGINPQTIADHITMQWQRRHPHPGIWAIVVVEACGAATFVRRVAAALMQTATTPQRIALIGVGGDDSAGNLGQFRLALQAALESYTDNDEQIPVTELISNLRNRIEPNEVVDRGMHKAAPLNRRRLLPAVAASMDIYAEVRSFIASLAPDQRGHFIPKAQGGEHGELAWYFVGRHAELQRIVSWIREAPEGMLVVTGRAGSGKSALLGNVLVRSNPNLTDLLIRAGYLEPLPSAEQPPAEPFDAIVHLTGLTTNDLVSRLANAAALPPVPRRNETAGGADWLIDCVSQRDAPFTLLADALDEAQEPITIAGSVLRRLARLPNVRVIVGTRSSTHEGPDQPHPTDADILDALGQGSATQAIIIERDPAAIATYVHRRLSAARHASVINPSDTTIADVAALVGGRNREFLFARLAVHEILARPHLLLPEQREALVSLLEADHRTMFAAAVRRLGARAPAYGPLLEVLALARGRGVPRVDRIWTVMANALATTVGTVTENDIDGLLVDAAPYVMLDAEGGQSVYRLAHRTFHEHFLSAGQSHF